MRDKDLLLTQNLITFENLTDLLDCLDDSIAHYNSAIERYGERLGALIRQGKTPRPDSSTTKQNEGNKLEAHQKRPSVLGSKDPWIVFKPDKKDSVPIFRVANTSVQSPASAESAILYRVIDTLKEKVKVLDSARKTLSDLPPSGIRSDQRFLVSFSDGLPRHIIPTHQSYSTEAKFSFSGEFELHTMSETEALSPS